MVSPSIINSHQPIEVQDLDSAFGEYIDLAVDRFGGKVLRTSDEWFAEASNLNKVAAPISRKGHFTAKGAWFDGWESKRHGTSFDWTVIRLGYPGSITGFEVDTAFFTGNHAPFVSVEGYTAKSIASAADASAHSAVNGSEVNGELKKSLKHLHLSNGHASAAAAHSSFSNESEYYEDGFTLEDWATEVEWTPILSKVALKPSSRHGFRLSQPTTTAFTHVRLCMYPDGGVARLRVYGKVSPVLPKDEAEVFDLASIATGAQVEAYSDAHFGHPSNLLLPGRGTDMSDGWETKRSRSPGHHDWSLIKLGAVGHPTLIEVDTAHYMGNPPREVTLVGYEESDSELTRPILLLDQAKVTPHRQHFFEIPEDKLVVDGVRKTIHKVKLTMIPDGGIKRLRVFGSQAWPPAPLPAHSTIGQRQPLPDEDTWHLPILQAEPITKEAFAPWGSVIEVPEYDPKAIKVNQGTAQKFSHLSYFVNWRPTPGEQQTAESSRPDIAPAQANIAIFQCYQPLSKPEVGVKLLERHPYSSQMFVPMGGDGNGGYVVVVAKDRLRDGNPDVSTLRAFTVKNSQGINYKPNVWHHPMIVTGRPVTFLTITHESGVAKDDCEEYWFTKESGKEGGIAALVRL
ncbi:Allantoicase [Actinomortierella ambigua]|nr:Allantoicase [Actinomortierella ambigua]